MGATLGAMGLRPVGRLGQRGQAFGFMQMKIASGYNTNLFHGDLVLAVNDGTVAKDTGTTTATPIGVFMGCSYTDADMGFLQRQHWPANQVASDAYAYVCNDPDAIFKVQADATLGQTAIGNNAAIVQGAGNTSTGNSGVLLNAGSIATTATLPLRIIDFWDRDEIDSTYPQMLVKINEGDHAYRNTTGV